MTLLVSWVTHLLRVQRCGRVMVFNPCNPLIRVIRDSDNFIKKPETGGGAVSFHTEYTCRGSAYQFLFSIWTQKSGNPCEIFHKKTLDRYLNLLYYRVSLTL